MITRTRILYLTGPLLFLLSFPPLPTGFLAYIALLPFFELLRQNQYRFGFRTGYGLGLLTMGIFIHWLNANTGATLPQATGMYLGTIMYLALYWGCFGAVQSFIQRKLGERGLWLAPFLWASLDYVQSLGELGFTWHNLATTQSYYLPLIQFIDITGIYGLSFWIALVNVIIFKLINAYREQQKNQVVSYAVGLGMIFLLPLVYGFLSSWRETSEKKLRVAIIQPNIEPNRKWLEHDFAYEELLRLTQSIPEGKTDLIIWPETAIPVRLRQDRTKLAAIREILKEKKASLLTGIPDRKTTETEDGRRTAEYYNAALVIRPDNTQLGNYEKVHLVPFGEFVPSFLKFLDAIAMEVGASNYTPGDSVHAFTIPLYSDSIPADSACITAVICLESIFPYLVREGLERDAQALVIVTNDSWYDGTMAPEQHARIAVLRAIEFRTSVARCANSGVSNAIDPYGRITAKLDNGLQGVLYATIPLQTSTSIYMRWGDWFAHSLWVITTLSLCFLFFYKPSKLD